MDLGLDFEGWAPHGWIAEGRTIPRGVIVPHRNRTRFLGWFPIRRSRGSATLPVSRQDGGFPSQRRLPDSAGAVPIAGSHSKSRRKHHIKAETMLSALYLDIQARRVVTFCRFSVALFVSENRQIVQENCRLNLIQDGIDGI